jgi:hypothetical protein
MFAPLHLVRSSRTRRGAVAFEALLIVPLFLTLAAGVVGIADLLITEQLIGEASGRAARTAALGGTEEQVIESIQAVLGSDRTQHAKVYIGSAHGEPGPVPPGELIEVRIQIEARHATVTRLVPVSSDEPLIGRTVMQRE